MIAMSAAPVAAPALEGSRLVMRLGSPHAVLHHPVSLVHQATEGEEP